MDKRAKNNGGTDRISNLPDGIRCRILSLLPTDVAVRTSILSTKWRYLFSSLSGLDIDFRFINPQTVDSFAKFMLKRLYLHTEILEHFRLKPVKEIPLGFERLYDWISASLHRGVRELDLDLSWIKHDIHSYTNRMPSDIFICKTLQFIAFYNMVRLEINHMHPDRQQTGLYEFLQVLPNLRTLVLPYGKFDKFRSPSEILPASCLLSHLKEIQMRVFDDLEMVEYILLNARVLEKLKIRMCGMIQQQSSILRLARSSKKCEVEFF
ncbi:hypothetical protein COLO4_28254 [Corchorus olitorius]|uniref:FBD domain-containing protein n=1 Tax=Corchorus olitorius TaxID=93759 RepID=A0A1R3HM50_9ROSI|nr:hypothetical protein COLO4_28254 [Corchorus olitorius]